MDDKLKQRLLGAAIILSLGVIFIPMLLDGGRHADFKNIQIEIPKSPEDKFDSSIKPLEAAKPIVEISRESRQSMPVLSREAKEPPAVVDEELAEILKPAVPIGAPTVVETMPAPDKKPATEEEQPSKPVAVQPPVVSQPEKPVSESPESNKPVSPQAKPTPTASAAVSSWVIQVGSFSRWENAISLRDQLRKNGFPGFVESFEKAGNPAFRVRVGPEIRRDAAERMLVRIKKQMSLDGIVVSYP